MYLRIMYHVLRIMNLHTKLILFIIAAIVAIPVSAKKVKFPGGKQYVFRITLADKKGSPYSTSKPEEFLSQKAIERRRKQRCKIDQTDLPLSPIYLKTIEKECGKIVSKSKWNNSVLVVTKDPAEKALWRQKMEFIKDVIRVWETPDSINIPDTRDINRQKFSEPDTVGTSIYGIAEKQISMLRGIKLHEAGFKGEGKSIAIIDAGFQNADVLPLLKNSKVRLARDFCWPISEDIYAESSHGMSVLSCMAMNVPNIFVGTAPEASYILLRSEYSEAETSAEEDYWCAAAEFADSIGVDIICSSLGYTEFDKGSLVNYAYKDLNGKTAQISKAASILAQKGIIGVVSAGNSGNKVWKKINFLSDAQNILAVGAVDSKGVIATFSSVGNSADGRIKPDVVAQGYRTQCLTARNFFSALNGTSFSAPVLCGMVACLWQALPEKTAIEIIDIIRKNGDRADFPDNIYGYGLPDFWKAYNTNK